MLVPAILARFWPAIHATPEPTLDSLGPRQAGRWSSAVFGLHELDLSQPTISHRLKILSEGLLEAERRRTWAYYRFVPEAIADLQAAPA